LSDIMDRADLQAFIRTTRAALTALLAASPTAHERAHLLFIQGALDLLSAQGEEAGAGQREISAPLKVLVVDDREPERAAAMEVLTRMGHLVDGVAAGFRATGRMMRAVASNEPYGAVLLHTGLKDVVAADLAKSMQREPRWMQPKVALLGVAADAAPIGVGGLPDPLTDAAFRAWLTAAPAPDPVVLVADDSRVNQKLAEAMLRRLGYRALIVDDGVKAVAQHQAQGVIAVLMDGQMPELDGYAATAAIRALEAKQGDGTHLPIIGLTADSFAHPQALAAGMDDCLIKPVTFEDLYLTLARFLGPAPTAPTPTLDPMPSAFIGAPQPTVRMPSRLTLDNEALRQLRLVSGDDSLLREVCQQFLADLPSRQRALQAALNNLQWEDVARLAHALKSASRAVGAATLGNLCEALEHPAPTPPPPHLTLADALTDACAQAHRALRALLGDI
jgi:two-component system, sensor histidine kinase and response regulator